MGDLSHLRFLFYLNLAHRKAYPYGLSKLKANRIFTSMELKNRIQSLAEEIYPQVLSFRHHIHQYPELSFEEAETAAYIAQHLTAWGIPFESGIAGHGIAAYIKGEAGESHQVVALRADMDALPIVEDSEKPYASKRTGVMHACGHDVHSSSLLGTVYLLNTLKAQFAGTIKCIFQPAEERFPGGASLMIKEGVLKNPEVDAIVGQHVLPYLDCGKIGVRKGMYMASADEIYLRVIGKGGHAAHPATFVDPVAISAQILVALQQVVSRSDPRIPSVLSFGKILANGATNIIPNEVYIEGTFRTMDEAWRAEAHRRIHSTVNGIAESMGAKAELDLKKGYPVLFNDEQLSGQVRESIAEYVGEENVVDLDLWMAAEDFAYYTHEVPGCFYRLGTRNEAKGITHGLHTPKFDIDEDALKLSTGLMAWVTLQQLKA